jgi:site-specific recombinase XerC
LIQERKLAWSSYKQSVCALRFFNVNFKARTSAGGHSFPRHEQRLPLVLSREEAARIVNAPVHIKSRALLMTIYAAGLRVRDIDSAHTIITVHQEGSRGHAVPGFVGYFASVLALRET